MKINKKNKKEKLSYRPRVEVVGNSDSKLRKIKLLEK